MVRSAAGLLAALLLAGSAFAQPDPLSPEGIVLGVEARRYRAMIEPDVAILEEILADDLRFTHASGSVESKYEFIASLESGNLDYESIETRDVLVRIYEKAAVVTGAAKLAVVSLGQRRSVDLLYTAVYVRGEKGWRLVSYQSTQRP